MTVWSARSLDVRGVKVDMLVVVFNPPPGNLSRPVSIPTVREYVTGKKRALTIQYLGPAPRFMWAQAKLTHKDFTDFLSLFKSDQLVGAHSHMRGRALQRCPSALQKMCKIRLPDIPLGEHCNLHHRLH